MKTSSLLLGLFFSAATLSPALAATAVPSPKAELSGRTSVADDAVTGSKSGERKICRKQETTGSRLGGERTCLTKAQWRIVDNGGSVMVDRNALSRR